MHYNRLDLQVNPNNQVVLTFGNYRHVSEVYKSVACLREGLDAKGKLRLSRAVARVRRKREPKVNWRGQIIKPAAKRPLPPLDIIKKSQRAASSCRLNRPKSFTQASGQKIRECGAAVDHVCGDPSLTHEVTLTLPANHQAAFYALAAYSAYIINRLFQPIRRDYGDDCLWFFVWEYQKRGALHLHIATHHKDRSTGLAIAKKLIEQWHKILVDVGEMAGTCMFAHRLGDRCIIRSRHQHHTSPMRRSLGAYFSKYAGKKESKQSWYCRKYPISRFWGCCYALKELISDLSFDFTLKVDDSSYIETLVQKIIARLNSKDLNLQSMYDFDIGKTYNSRDRVCFAQGTRLTFYCHPKEYKSLLVMFDDLTHDF